MRRTIEQERAADALDKVIKLESANQQDFNEKYVSYVESLPATILMNGFGQALATLQAAARSNTRDDSGGQRRGPHQVLFEHISGWLCRDSAAAPYRGESHLMAAITGNDRSVYLRAQAETLAWLVWLKKFAVAYLKKSGGDES